MNLPSWWTIDNTPGSESVDFAGKVSVSPDNVDATPLTINVPSGGSDAGTTPFAVRRDPTAPDTDGNPNLLELGYQGQLAIFGPPTGGGGLYVHDDESDEQTQITGRAISMDVNEYSTYDPEAIFIAEKTGGTVFSVFKTGVVKFSGHASVNGTGLLHPGDLTLYFDDTNGAAKLMIEAKQADGTLVHGEVPLSP
jgi:hypothetical protein